MDNPTPQEIRLNIEAVKEDIATLKLKQDKDSFVLYGGEPGIDFPGMVEDVKVLKEAIKNINGMPKRIESLNAKVDTMIETDKRRVNIVKGMVAGLALQGGGIAVLLAKVFS